MAAMASKKSEVLAVAGREVTITNPDKVLFPQAGHKKIDLVRYFLAVADGALRGVRGRPMALKRFVDGTEKPAFFQKRAPESRPPWIDTVELAFPSGRTAREVVVNDAAQLAWVANLGCVDLNPHPVRADDLEHPDELRIDLDPVPGVQWPQLVEVAVVVRAVLEDHGLVGWPKTSGSRGIHIYARVERRWTFPELRHAALAVAREVERRAPSLATSRWWKEERHGVFLDYNQNAKDRTVASAYSVRPTVDARVSMPVTWEELTVVDPADFTLATTPARFAERGDPAQGIDEAPGSLERLLALSEQQLAEQGEAPLPPHYAKEEGEPPRVMPSRRRAPKESAQESSKESREPNEAAPGRRRPTKPLLTIARAQAKEDALAGLERWKARHPEAAPHLEEKDVLVDSMRGRSTTWTRIRVNLEHVPEELRPAAEPPDPDVDPNTLK
jgi:bifunctional non-homologous end joining protein LigD